MNAGSGLLVNGFHGDPDRNNKFWLYPADRELVTLRWDTHGDPHMFCRNAVLLDESYIDTY